MDNEKIDIVMNKLNDIKSASLDYSAETIDKQIELYCDTMEDSYKKYIKDLVNKENNIKDVSSTIEDFQDKLKQDISIGSAVISAFNLTMSGQIYSELIDTVISEGTKFILEPYPTEKKASDDYYDFDGKIQNLFIKFNSFFGSKEDRTLTKAIPDAYFANELLSGILDYKRDDITDVGPKGNIQQFIEKSYRLFKDSMKSQIEAVEIKKSLPDVYKIKRTAYQRMISIMKTATGNYFNAMQSLLKTIKNKIY